MAIRTLQLAGIVSVAFMTSACVAASGGNIDGSTGSAPPSSTYWAYVGAESADVIHRVRFDDAGAVVEKTTPVGDRIMDTDGPHGLVVSRDGRFLYLTTGHGLPDGKLWKFEIGADTLVAQPIPLGRFPASIDVTPDGLYVFAVNFNLHGEMVPSSVSVVYTPSMTEVARTETCTMPHGSRISPDGLRHYSACMMDDQLVELDTRTFQVARRFSVAVGEERPLGREDRGHHTPAARHGEHAGHASHYEASCSPTWADTHPSGDRIFVACNRSDELLEIDADEWTLIRRFSTGRGPYNLEVTPDGRILVVTLKQGNAVEFFDLEKGERLARSETSTTVTHGVVVSPDSRYAFVSVEGVGAEPGKVDVYDLTNFKRVADVEVGQQAAGITFWRTEP